MSAPNSENVSDTFIRPCLACGATVRVEASVEQPHDCRSAESAAELIARAWWNGYDQATQHDEARAQVAGYVREVERLHILRPNHFESLDMTVVCCAVCSVAEDDYPCPDLVAARALAAAVSPDRGADGCEGECRGNRKGGDGCCAVPEFAPEVKP